MASKMTVGRLIELLQELTEDDETILEREVCIQTQPSYPLVSRLDGVWMEEDEVDDDSESKNESAKKVLYLVEGGQVGYGTRRAFSDPLR
jgi:hypothetical protein